MRANPLAMTSLCRHRAATVGHPGADPAAARGEDWAPAGGGRERDVQADQSNRPDDGPPAGHPAFRVWSDFLKEGYTVESHVPAGCKSVAVGCQHAHIHI
jgi:hypothetical protein